MSFKSFLQTVGRDFKKGLDLILPWAEGAGEVAVSIFAPALGPLFNQTVAAVITAEQAAVAAGQQKGGVAKLAAVVTFMGPLIKQALIDAGKPGDDAAVEAYINAIVQILNAAPAQTPAPAAS